jgi:hypothetical protein
MRIPILRRRELRILLVILGLFLFLLATLLPSSPYLKIEVDRTDGSEHSLRNLKTGETEISISFKSLPKKLEIQVDDCLKELTINGQLIQSPLIPYCDWTKTLVLPLDGVPELKINTLTAKVTNDGGAGLFLPFTNRAAQSRLIKSLMLGFGLLLIILSFSNRNLGKLFIIFLILLVSIRSIVAGLIPVESRSSDFGGHIDYVHYVLSHWSMPKAEACWQCYQPPLFYFSAVGYGIAFGSGTLDEDFLYLFPLTISVLCCYVYGRILQRVLKKDALLLVAAPIFLLPGVVHGELAFNNDVLAHFFSALALYFGLIWFESKRPKELYLTSLMIALGMFSKYTVLPIAVWWGIIVSYHCLVKRRDLKLLLTSLGAVVIFCLPYQWLRWKETGKAQLVGNIGNLNSALGITNEIWDFLTFSPIAIIKTPYLRPFSQGFHRDSFFEYLFLTGIFMEVEFKNLLLTRIAVGSILLTMGIFCFYFLTNFKILVRPHFHLILCIVLLVASVAANRVFHPFVCSSNFRYILPAIIPMAILFSRVYEDMTFKAKFALMILASLGIFTSWSAVFLGS